MFFTLTSPDAEVDRVHLFPDVDAAVTEARGVQLVYQVDVELDEPSRRVTPSWVDDRVFDSAWRTPAEIHADGSITVRGPIPSVLFSAVRGDH